MDQAAILTAVVSILGGGAVFGFVQFLIQRRDDSLEKKIDTRFDQVDAKVDEINGDLKRLDRKIDDSSAKQARVRVLRFADELQEGHKFSRDSFSLALDDISFYKKHCNKYKDFPNDKADSAMRYIKKVYDESLGEPTEFYHGKRAY